MNADISIVRTSMSHQVVHAEALREGFDAIGLHSAMHIVGQNIPTKKVACWGWRIGKKLRDRGYDVLVMERGYLGDRFSYTSLGWNGLNGYAAFPKYSNDGGVRLRSQGVVLKPWKTGGKYALILGQVPRDASLRGIDIRDIYIGWADEIKRRTGLPVMFRQHPDVLKRGIAENIFGTIKSVGSLTEALNDAVFCVAFNSNSLVDSVVNGVPSFAGDRGTMAWPMCSIDKLPDSSYPNLGLFTPDREEWANNLAWTQWTVPEIKSGFPLKALMEMI